LSSTYPPVLNFFLIGKSLKSHGTAGKLRLALESQFKSYIKQDSFLFFNLDGSKVPFKINEVEDNAHFVIGLEDVTNKKDSDLLAGNDIWIEMDVVKPRHQRSPRNIKDKWEEYQLLDTRSNTTFTIERVEEFPQQLMAVVRIEDRERLIPLSEQLISSIDRQNKLITMELPEGLLEI
jgi:16S rRNA processing protein RimM